MTGVRSGAGAVVVPAVRAGSSLACVRSLGRHGVPTIAVAEDVSTAVTQSKYCRESSHAPSPETDIEGYTRRLLDLAQRPDVNTIVPLREPDIYVLSKHRDAFAEHIATPWKPFDDVRRTQDRCRLFDAARRADVSVPKTALADEWDRWTDTTVIKPRYSILADDDGIELSEVQFYPAGSDPDIDEIISEMGHVPIAQEYVTGDREHGFFALFDEGEPVATFQHRRIRSYDYAGGASTFRKSVSIPEIEEAGIRLLRELDWHGPAMVEFKRDASDGSFQLMEINPRFWGSLPLAIASGVDFPFLYYQLANGGVDRPIDSYDVDVGCHLLRGEMVYLYSLLTDEHSHVERPPLPQEVGAILRSLVTDRNFDYLSLSDPKPFFYDLVTTSLDAVSQARRSLP